MTWKTIVESIEVAPSGAANVAVIFVDEAQGRKEARRVQVTSPALETVKAALRRERALIDAVYAAKSDIVPGELDIDTPPVPDIPPTKEEQDRAAYLLAYNQFRAVRAQSQDGIAEQSDVDAALQAVKDLYKPEYLGVL
jgi:hypothetical protein